MGNPENAVAAAELYLFGHSSGGCAVLAAALKLGGLVKGIYIYEPINVDPSTMRCAPFAAMCAQCPLCGQGGRALSVSLGWKPQSHVHITPAEQPHLDRTLPLPFRDP